MFALPSLIAGLGGSLLGGSGKDILGSIGKWGLSALGDIAKNTIEPLGDIAKNFGENVLTSASRNIGSVFDGGNVISAVKNFGNDIVDAGRTALYGGKALGKFAVESGINALKKDGLATMRQKMNNLLSKRSALNSYNSGLRKLQFGDTTSVPANEPPNEFEADE